MYIHLYIHLSVTCYHIYKTVGKLLPNIINNIKINKNLGLVQVVALTISEINFKDEKSGLLLAPAEGFGLQPRLFWPFGQKIKLSMLFLIILGLFGVW